MPKSISVNVISSKYRKYDRKFWKSKILVFLYSIMFVLFVGGLVFFEEIQLKAHGIYISLTINSKLNNIKPSKNTKGFLIKTEGCRIPNLKTFDRSVRSFIFNATKISCNGGLPPLVEANLTHLELVPSALSRYGVKDPQSVHCCYSVFRRIIPEELQSDNQVKYENCVAFITTVKINEEFVKVICTNNKEIIYTDFFSFVPSKSNFQTLSKTEKYNVLIVGIDSISRLNLHRQMPNTIKVLKSLNAVEFLGFNKVGDNTFPNLIPVLTGLNVSELSTKCWSPKQYKFDDCKFIWNEAKKNFFVTAFGEDASKIGIFNYLKGGFTKAPTDYYWGPYSYVSEAAIGNIDTQNTYVCVGSRFIYKSLLDYILKFVYRMDVDDKAYFGFFWSNSISHDYLNLPKLADDDYADFFNHLEKDKVLNNTVVIFMSDHGIRWGDIRSTYQGQMEERLPFLFMLLPERFKKKNYKSFNNLVKNTQKLTTMFDVHETLRDLVNIQMSDEELMINPIFRRNFNRSHSLFEVIPDNRTCQSAGIESHWCTCQESVEILPNNTNVQGAALFAVEKINKKLNGYLDCAHLTLKEVRSARLHSLMKHLLVGKKWIQDYTVVFRTIPGDGLFEATVRHHLSERVENGTFSITGTISRINLYGSQSACITNFHLKLYCYCTR